MSDIVERLRAWVRPAGTNIDLPLYSEAADEIERLQAERDNWEAVCSGSIKEQFRLARENEARLKLALEQLNKAAAEIERLRAGEKVWREGANRDATEIERLQAALQKIADYPTAPLLSDFARRALEQARKE